MVRVGTVTRETESFVDEMLNHTRVQIDRIPVGRQVDAVPPVRQEGDTTVLRWWKRPLSSSAALF
jgi:hypothetical protein